MDGLLKLGAIRARLILAIIMLIIGVIVIMLIANVPLSPEIKKLLINYEEDYNPLNIQNIMWIFFFIGVGELLYRLVIGFSYNKGLEQSYLPEDETSLLTSNDTRDLYKKINKKIERVDDIPSMIKRLILHFNANKSISQTHDMLNSQIDMKYNNMDTQYSMIRYITWVIPTFGFIGTVIGISLSLAYAGANDPQATTFLQEITSRLGIAFDTTLLALCMSTFLVLMMHIIQSFEEQVMVKLEEYLLDNFINRLYV